MNGVAAFLGLGGPSCAQCGKRIVGPIVHAVGRDWHPHHLRCSVCRDPLGTSFLVSPHHEPYCSHHAPQEATCLACGHAVPAGGMEAGCCQACASEVPSGTREASAILVLVQTWLRQEGLPWWPQAFPVRQVDAHGFQPGTALEPDSLVGQILTRTTWDSQGRPVREVTEIRVLQGRPGLLFGSVLAHELGHAWAFQTGIQGVPEILEEGFCEWLSHRWLSASRDPRAPHLMERIASNPHPVYGDGFRLAHALAHDGGLPRLIEALKCPPGAIHG